LRVLGAALALFALVASAANADYPLWISRVGYDHSQHVDAYAWTGVAETQPHYYGGVTATFNVSYGPTSNGGWTPFSVPLFCLDMSQYIDGTWGVYVRDFASSQFPDRAVDTGHRSQQMVDMSYVLQQARTYWDGALNNTQKTRIAGATQVMLWEMVYDYSTTGNKYDPFHRGGAGGGGFYITNPLSDYAYNGNNYLALLESVANGTSNNTVQGGRWYDWTKNEFSPSPSQTQDLCRWTTGNETPRVPEPGTCVLLASFALIGLAISRKRSA